MNDRRIDWPAVALYALLGLLGAGFIGFVLWRLALAVNWIAAALLGFVILFGLLMVSFDLRGDRREPAAGPEPEQEEAPAPPPVAAAKPKRGRPRKVKPDEAAPAAPPPEDALMSRGPRNRAGRAPIPDPPTKSRKRNRN